MKSLSECKHHTLQFPLCDISFGLLFLGWLSKRKNSIKGMVKDFGAWSWRNAHWLLITYFLPPASPANCGNPASSWSPLHGQRWHLWPLRQGLRPPWQEEEVWHKGSQENAQSCLQWDLYFQGKLIHLVVTLYLLFIKTTWTSSRLMGRQVLLKVNCSSCLSLFLRALSSCLDSDFFFSHTYFCPAAIKSGRHIEGVWQGECGRESN